MDEQRQRWLVGGVLGLVVILGVANALSFWTINIDDSYISLRYARSLLQGDGLVYNPGERVEGFSNPTWVAVLVATLLLGSDSLEGSKLIGVLCHALTIVAAAGLALELTRAQRLAARLSVALGAGILGASLPASYWPITGMETTFYAALIVGTYWRLAVELRTPPARPWSALLAAVTALSRPEAPLVVGGAWLARLWAGRQDVRRLGVWMGIFFAPTLSYLAFRLVYYGYPLANTYYQKGSPGTLDTLADYLRPWVTLEAPFLVLGLVGLTTLARHSRASWPMLLGLAGHGVFLAVITRDWMANQRFIVPVLPLLATGIAAGAALLAERLPPRAAWGVPAAVVLLLGGQFWRSAPVQRADMEGAAVTFEPRDPWMVLPDALQHSWKGHAAVPIWLMEHAKPGASVAYTDIGMTGWITDYIILDLAGLVDASISGATGLTDWEQRAAYVGARRPDWIILKTAGKERFEAISRQAWLVQEYELMAGPRDTLAARRLDVVYASDAEILASFAQAVAREPASGRFLWRYAVWASAVGTPAQVAEACARIQQWPDLTEAQEGCTRLLAGRASRRPSTAPEPLSASLRRFLAGEPLVVSMPPTAPVEPDALIAADTAAVAPAPPLDAPRPPPPTPHENPFQQAGKRGIGRGWVAYPANKAEEYVSLADGELQLRQHSEAFGVCGPLEGSHGTGQVTVSGLWKAEAAGARVYLVAQDGSGKRLRDAQGEKDLVIVRAEGPRGWDAFSAVRALPAGTERVRICVDFQGENRASAWFSALGVLAEADAN